MDETEHLREMVNEKFKAVDGLLALAKQEVERRLDLLNHQAEQLKDMQATYVPREVYDRRHMEIEARLANLEKLIWKAIGGVTVLGTVIQILLHYIKLGG